MIFPFLGAGFDVALGVMHVLGIVGWAAITGTKYLLILLLLGAWDRECCVAENHIMGLGLRGTECTGYVVIVFRLGGRLVGGGV